MSVSQYRPPDTAALLGLLIQATKLCRRLDLPKDAATFDHFISRFREESPIPEASRDDVSSAINGIAGLRIINKLGADYSEYSRLQIAFGRVLFPEVHEAAKQPRRSLEERMEEHCEEIMASSARVEARQWMEHPSHVFFKTDRQEVSRFVEQFYSAGASQVLISGIAEEGKAQIGQGLLVVLPEDARGRAKLFEIGCRADEAFQCDSVSDKGQKYLYYSLD